MTTTTNADLAARARQLADAAPTGSLERRGALCAAVALGQSRTPTGARKILTGELADVEVRAEALTVLGALLDGSA